MTHPNLNKTVTTNQWGQQIGMPVPTWKTRALPSATILVGDYCRLEKLDATKHQQGLLEAYQQTPTASWTYLPIEPLITNDSLGAWLEQASTDPNAWHYAIVDSQNNQALGTLALMRADQVNGTIEVGYVIYSELLKQTRVATEAQYLLANYVFETLKYRRHEWKCDSLNTPSYRAALRLGFTYEGTFRQAVVYKGRTRDTAWLSMIDSEWPAIKRTLKSWLTPTNFDASGKQKVRLNPLNDH